MSQKRYTVVWASEAGSIAGGVEHMEAGNPGEASETCQQEIPPEARVIAVFAGHHDDLSAGEGT